MMRHLPIGLVTALLSLGTALSGQAPAQWQQWRGPSRDAVIAFTPPATWPQQLAKRWEVSVGAGHSSPVVSAGRVIIHARQGDQEITRALDLDAGKEVWRSAYAAPYTVNPAARAHGPGPKSTPAIAQGRVFTFGISGILSGHDLATGKVLWRTPAPPSPPEFGTAMSPVVDGPLVIAHVGGQNKGALTAFDAATGKARWAWSGDGPAYASPVIATIGGTRQVITQTQNAIVGIDAGSGALLWQRPFKTPYEQNSVTPVVAGDRVIYSGLDNGTWAVRPVKKGTAWTVEDMWRNEQVSMYMSTPVVSGNTLFGLSHRNRGQFFAVDVGTGKTLWTTTGREGENASLLLAGPLLLASTTNAELIVARPNPTKFDEIKRYTIADSAVWAHPALSGRLLLVKDVDKLICWSF
jgi:outer membrane protein assembly factor BamB